MLIAHGPSPEALIKSPIYPRDGVRHAGPLRGDHALRLGGAGRDDLAPVGEEDLGPGAEHRSAGQKGFSVIATANTRDRGVNDMSAALKRRFNIVVLPTPKTLETEIDIVRKRVARAGDQPGAEGEGARRRRRSRRSSRSSASCARARRSTARTSSRRPSGVLSTAEAISVLANSMALAGNFGTGEVTAARPGRRAAGLGRQGRGEGPRRLAGVPDERAEEARRGLAAAVHRLLGAQRVGDRVQRRRQ